MKRLDFLEDLPLFYLGPDVKEGPKPLFFYLALSAKDSLLTDPFNQPVTFLKKSSIRIFSATLPEHEEGKKPEEALKNWAKSFEEGKDPFSPFIEKVAKSIQLLIKKDIAIPKKIAIGGLSRGAFFAAHIAALVKDIKYIIGYAPLTQISSRPEFIELKKQESVNPFDLIHLREKIFNRNIRFYIGNRDKRVGTENCFSLIKALADTAFEKRIRPSLIELIIGPSNGYLGHGTSPEVFKDGMEWIKKQLLHNA